MAKGHNYHLNLTPAGDYDDKYVNIERKSPRKSDYSEVNRVRYDETSIQDQALDDEGNKIGKVKKIKELSGTFDPYYWEDEIDIHKDHFRKHRSGNIDDGADYEDDELKRDFKFKPLLRVINSYEVKVTANSQNKRSEWIYKIRFKIKAWTRYGIKNLRPWWHKYWYGNPGTKTELENKEKEDKD